MSALVENQMNVCLHFYVERVELQTLLNGVLFELKRIKAEILRNFMLTNLPHSSIE